MPPARFWLLFALGLFTAGSAGVAASQSDAGAGKQLFAGTGCAHCHGDNLAGTDRAPGLQDVGRRMKPEQIQNQIVHGGTSMPAFGDVLSQDQIVFLVDYLRRQRARHPAKPAAATQSR